MSGMSMSGGVLLAPPEHHWRCPACDRTAVTREARPHSQLHACPSVGGLMTPYAPDTGARVLGRVSAQVREDYEKHAARIGPETLHRDDTGRPYTSVTTEYDGGSHVALFLPGIHISTGSGS